MIKSEIKNINGEQFNYVYSDTFMIRKIGTDEIYYEAYDPIEFKDERKYEETDICLSIENNDFIDTESFIDTEIYILSNDLTIQ